MQIASVVDATGIQYGVLQLAGIAMHSCPMVGLEPIGQTSEGCHADEYSFV
jgi:hypothetical protein